MAENLKKKKKIFLLCSVSKFNTSLIIQVDQTVSYFRKTLLFMDNTCKCTCIPFSNLAFIKDDLKSCYVYIIPLVVMSGKYQLSNTDFFFHQVLFS